MHSLKDDRNILLQQCPRYVVVQQSMPLACLETLGYAGRGGGACGTVWCSVQRTECMTTGEWGILNEVRLWATLDTSLLLASLPSFSSLNEHRRRETLMMLLLLLLLLVQSFP